MYKLGGRPAPYSYTRCFMSEVDFNVISVPFILLTVLLETVLLPIYPLIFYVHKHEPAHRNEGTS